ncbi:MAG: hypothetical protein WA803_14790 [Steroidobacteraceae bacterium]
MRNAYKALGLLLLLLTAQQGAVDHELGHFSNAAAAEIRINAGGVVDTTCAQCPAFAQVVTPAFSHSFHIPLLVRTESLIVPERRCVAADSAAPRPRSRGPPSYS